MKIVGWIAGLTALFLVLYYYVGTTSVTGSVFSGASTIIGRLQGRDNSGALPAGYPK